MFHRPLSVKRSIAIFIVLVFLMWLSSYPQPKEVWSTAELANNITNKAISSITTHIIGATAITIDGETVFVLTNEMGKDNLIRKLKDLGVSNQSIDSLEIKFVGIKFNPIFIVVALLLIGLIGQSHIKSFAHSTRRS